MLELMYNMMNLKLKQKGKVTGYIPGATAVEAGMRYGIATNDELDLFFEKIFDGFASPHIHISCPDGAKIYAADVTQELVEFSMEAQAGNTVMYVPAECKKLTCCLERLCRYSREVAAYESIEENIYLPEFICIGGVGQHNNSMAVHADICNGYTSCAAVHGGSCMRSMLWQHNISVKT